MRLDDWRASNKWWGGKGNASTDVSACVSKYMDVFTTNSHGIHTWHTLKTPSER